jgi:protein N-terminal methyltransferase
LGGFGHLTPLDVRDSNLFLDKLHDTWPVIRFNDVVDCGAGIGRVTKNLLLLRSDHVTMVEQSPRLLKHAVDYLALPLPGKRVDFVQQGLQVLDL